MGRGILAGNLVLWPTARRPYGVFAIRQEDGRQPDNPALLHRLPAGNLVWANGRLLVADQRQLWAFVPSDEEVRNDTTEVQHLVATNQWRRLLASPNLRRCSLEDAHGLPRLAATVAQRRVDPAPDGVAPSTSRTLLIAEK